jgi:hypothetical protein
MGRGRAKAKQTKVARELKYHSPNTDLAALQRELGGVPTRVRGRLVDEFDDEPDDDEVGRERQLGRALTDPVDQTLHVAHAPARVHQRAARPGGLARIRPQRGRFVNS